MCEDDDPPCYYEAHDYEAFNFVNRLDGSGSIDPGFNAEMLDQIEVFAIARQPDGKIIAVGRSVDFDVGISDVAIFRLRDDGRLDTTFGDNGIVVIDRNGNLVSEQVGHAVHLDASGRIVVAGSVNNKLTVLRLLPDGALDHGFGNAGFFDSDLIAGYDHFDRSNTWTHLVPTTSGGYRITEADEEGCRIVALSAGGAIDTSFADSGRAVVETTQGESVVCRAILSQADGKILVAGTSGDRGFALRLLETGELDTTFVADPVIASAMEDVTAMGLREDGSVLVAGAGVQGASIAQLQANGELDPLFGSAGMTWIDLTSETGLYQSIHELAVDADGRVLAAGEDDWTDSPFAIRLLGTGGGDSSGVLGFGDRAVTATELGGQATIRVRRTGGRAGRVSVGYRTAEYQFGGATVGEDYEAVTGRLTWEDGDATDQQVVIPIHQDAGTAEVLERFSVVLHDIEGGAGLGAFGATVDIEADGAPFGQFELEVPSPSVTENETVFALVRRNFFAQGEVSVTVTPVAGSATSGEDFVGDPVILTWADGDSEAKWVEFNVVDDAIAEPLESYSLELASPRAARSSVRMRALRSKSRQTTDSSRHVPIPIRRPAHRRRRNYRAPVVDSARTCAGRSVG